MVRFHWFLLSLIGSFFLALPAEAAKLVFWRFESGQNRLVFTTDERVQPRAQLITNPTRIVIDLPNVILGRPSVTQNFSGKITSIRIGQFDAQTTRLVIELAPGYTVDPQKVKVRGLSPTQWTVELPEPERVDQSAPPSLPPPSSPSPPSSRSPATAPPSTASTGTADFQVTRNGLFVRLDRNGDERKVRIKRSRDRQKIEILLPGANLPSSLSGKTLAVNDYGVESIAFEQNSESVGLTLLVNRESPDWQALYSKFGGLVLLPRGGLSSRTDFNPSPVTPAAPVTSETATLKSLELAGNNSQLTINSDRPIRGTGNWNSRQGLYEIRIPNARVSDAFRGPRLGSNSPVYQVKILKDGDEGVLITVEPNNGFSPGGLSQPSDRVLVLDLISTRMAVSSNSAGATLIPVPPPPNSPPPLVQSLPRSTPNPTSAQPGPRRGKRLVVIDPGHGGKDPGAIGIGGLQEKDVILPISLEVARYLEQKGIDVLLTRNSDFFVTLQGRTDMSNRAGADLFVSIHANSMGMGRPDVSGLEVYYFGNRGLSDAIHRSIIRSVEVRDRGVRRARFYVLRNSKMPSTLVEVGFVTGADDAANLRNPTYLSRMAEAIARGILEYIQEKLP